MNIYFSTVKIVYASTRQIYGKPAYLPVDEKHPRQPVDVNGINKLAGELYHILYNNIYNISTCALRLTNTYGPCMRVKDARQTFLGIWIRLLLDGKPMQVFGDGTQIRDLNYVDDVVEAFLMAAASKKTNGEIFNLGASDNINLRNLAELIIELYGCGEYNLIPFPPGRKSIDIGDYFADFSRIHSILGWEPKISLREGLNRTLEYYRTYKEKYWPKG